MIIVRISFCCLDLYQLLTCIRITFMIYYNQRNIFDIERTKEYMIKRTMISLRIDRRTVKRLDKLGDETGMSKSDVVRQAIKLMSETYLDDDVVVSQVEVEDKPSDGDVGTDTGV